VPAGEIQARHLFTLMPESFTMLSTGRVLLSTEPLWFAASRPQKAADVFYQLLVDLPSIPEAAAAARGRIGSWYVRLVPDELAPWSTTSSS
jgi:hypothetical protein